MSIRNYLVSATASGVDITYPRGTVCHMTAGYGQTQASDAAFIVTACNAHDDLVAALRLAQEIIDGYRPHTVGDDMQIRAALAKAQP